MQTSTRVIFNTIVLYVKVILSLAIAFVSIPLVLNALGASDYGLYNLVAGVVAMLSFLNNSMTVSTQRFMSVAMGEKNEEKINSIYNTSFLLHLLLGLLVVLRLLGYLRLIDSILFQSECGVQRLFINSLFLAPLQRLYQFHLMLWSMRKRICCLFLS